MDIEAEAEEGAEITYFGNQVDEPPSSGLETEHDMFRRLIRMQPTTQYRETSIGRSLKSALDELLERNKISLEMYNKTMCQFDRTMLTAISQKVTSRVAFKAEKLRCYKFLDGVWCFELDHVEFREYNSFANVPNVKIMAFDSKAPDKQKVGGVKRRWGQSQAGEVKLVPSSETNAKGKSAKSK